MNKEPPHLYPDGSLCLFYPPGLEWRPTMYVAEMIIPWAAEWLFFYELWLVGGHWYGGGRHAASKTEEAPRSRDTETSRPTPRKT